ncbi:ATP-binding protein [Chloroflexota bacterium]
MEFKNREELNSLIMEHVADIVWIADKENRLVYVSPSVTKVLGYTVEEALNISMEDVFTPESLASILEKRAEDFDNKRERRQLRKKSQVLLQEMYHKNGSIIAVEINASVVFDTNGQPNRFLSVARDVTKLKQAERSLKLQYDREKKLRKSLESEVMKRTEFARVLFHELKNPLSAIFASAGLLLESNQEAPYDRVVKSIHRSSSELNERIDELLELTRAEVGELRIKPRHINPSKMIADSIKDIEPIISERKLHLRTEIPSMLHNVSADKQRIRQVMQNLVTNAIKATPEGGEIKIKVIEKDAYFIVGVQDTGRGIKHKDQTRIFEPYYRVPGIAERYEGMGLGLTLSKRIVELHGGQIWVESKVGKGSTFSFSIPLSKS